MVDTGTGSKETQTDQIDNRQPSERHMQQTDHRQASSHKLQLEGRERSEEFQFGLALGQIKRKHFVSFFNVTCTQFCASGVILHAFTNAIFVSPPLSKLSPLAFATLGEGGGQTVCALYQESSLLLTYISSQLD